MSVLLLHVLAPMEQEASFTHQLQLFVSRDIFQQHFNDLYFFQQYRNCGLARKLLLSVVQMNLYM